MNKNSTQLEYQISSFSNFAKSAILNAKDTKPFRIEVLVWKEMYLVKLYNHIMVDENVEVLNFVSSDYSRSLLFTKIYLKND